jgi:hypothetical protein
MMPQQQQLRKKDIHTMSVSESHDFEAFRKKVQE